MTRHESKKSNRERFFEAAMKVCVEKGWANTRMDDIAKASGRSKGSLYHHFESKDVLFIDMLQHHVNRYAEAAEMQLAEGMSVRDIILGMSAAFDEQVEDEPEMMIVFMEGFLAGLRAPKVQDVLREHYQRAIDGIEQLIILGVQQGEFSKAISPRALARLFATAGDGMMMTVLSLQLPRHEGAGLIDLVRLLLDGAANQTHSGVSRG
ncbi:MAG: TetR/AcrR family transcriptional regulator [Deltaproteobacteria bacterium]|nr:TetR/AcrR family transcriptional regulator [Deltaproteobacteria bacterium]